MHADENPPSTSVVVDYLRGSVPMLFDVLFWSPHYYMLDMSVEVEFISVTLPTSNLIVTSLAVVETLGKLLNSTGFLWMKLLIRGIDPRGLGTGHSPPQKKME